MKVICIAEPKEARNIATKKPVDIIPLIVGEYYHVIRTRLLDGHTFFDLKETQISNKTTWHHSKLFAPVSGLDETEMERDWMFVENNGVLKI